MTNISRITFIGNSSSFPTDVSRIICTDATLTFMYVLMLDITLLDFHSCRIQLDDTFVVFRNSSFNNATTDLGGAIYAHSSGITFWDSKFENNTANYGGTLYAYNSIIAFQGVTTFESNIAAVAGGGIFANHSSLTFHGTGGDGILGNYSSTEDFTGVSQFLNNSAEYGGGIFVWYSVVSFGDDSRFINNSAVHGGGVSICGSIVSFSDDSIFINNSAVHGGGVSVWYSTVGFGDGSSFITNSAEGYGGGICSCGSNASFGYDSRFIYNSAAVHGGGVYVCSGNMSFGDDSSFIDNSAELYGGGSCVEYDSNVSYGDDSRFINNSAWYGSGVYAWESTLSFGDENSFINNSAEWFGGAVGVWYSTVRFGDGSSFKINSAEGYGGGVFMEESSVSFDVDSTFITNSAELSGGGVYVVGGTVNFGADSSFINNSAEQVSGGGVYVQESTVNFDNNSRFINNSAERYGGGIYVQLGSTVRFADSTFAENSAGYFGGCVAAESSSIDVGGSSDFTDNMASYGGCIFVKKCDLKLNRAALFSGNSAITSNGYSGGSGNVYIWGYGGAILALTSNLTFGGPQVLTNNLAGHGGAIYLTTDSKIYLLSDIMYFARNVAQYRGGALFVEDSPFTYCTLETENRTNLNLREACFIQIEYIDSCVPKLREIKSAFDGRDIELNFQDNLANEAGTVLYGGNLDSCGVCIGFNGVSYVLGEEAFNTWANISSNLTSSDPYRVCVCEDNLPDCSQGNTTREIFPGATIVVPLVALGQYDGTVPAVIQTYPSEGIALDDLQHTQQSNNTCTNLQYTASIIDINTWSEATLTLYADEPCSVVGVPLEILVKFLPCPPGFTLSSEGSCECEHRLHKYEVECDINDQSMLRKDNTWVGFDQQSQGLILHPYCPFDYCKAETDSVNFTMNNTDLQCNHNRSGHLCGACQHSFSLSVGSSRCLPCSNKFLALLIPFVFAGLALVIFLFICKVTVAAGTISGLIFYANTVAVNQSVFFPSGESNILTVFIAWLNLDLGIETCFFDGMDAYSMTWLQFVFPIYIWLLVGLITVICNVSTTAARILGSTNPIAILATLFLLSYTKLLRTIIAAFSFTTLEYPVDETKVVWLYDGNIGYLDKNDGRHIALFLVSLLVFPFLFLPYTIFLLFGQCILPRLDLNKLRWLSWANYLRMKSFLDAYHAPYKDRHRYWIGLLLVVRFILFLISAIVDIESPQNPHVNLLVIIISTSMLGTWVWSGVYKKWYLNVLELSFILNLAILAAATYQVKLAGGNQAAVFHTSVTFAFFTFMGIVIYHVYQCLRDSRPWRNLVRMHNERRRERGHGWQREDDEDMEEMLPQAAPKPPTVTYVDIPMDERRQMRPITPPLSLTNFNDAHEPFNHKEAVADEEMEEIHPHATPTVMHTDVPTDEHREMRPITPPPQPVNFHDLREPLDLLTQ